MMRNGSLRVKKKVVVGIAEGLLDFQAQLEGRILVSALNLCVVAPAHAQSLAESLLGIACALSERLQLFPHSACLLLSVCPFWGLSTVYYSP